MALAHGFHASRIDGSAMVYNQADVSMPDLLICRPELADHAGQLRDHRGLLDVEPQGDQTQETGEDHRVPAPQEDAGGGPFGGGGSRDVVEANLFAGCPHPMHTARYHSLVVARDEVDRAALVGVMKLVGGVLGVWEAHEVMRGLKTLAVRLDRQCDNARRLAERLDGHPATDHERVGDKAERDVVDVAFAFVKGLGTSLAQQRGEV